MNHCFRLVSAVFVLSGVFTATLRAQVPNVLNYQGRIAVGTTNFDGTGQFKFALVNATGAITYWSNDGTSSAGGEPLAAVSLAVARGLYSVRLGDTALANMVAVPLSVFSQGDVRLRVWFSDGVNGFQLLAPDQRIAANGYAMMAGGLNLPATTGPDAGVIRQDGAPLLHTFGTENVFAGAGAGNFTTTGGQYTALGAGALSSVSFGSGNTAVGKAALASATVGSLNSALGASTLAANVVGNRNVAIGHSALNATTGENNTGVGSFALQNNTTGSGNIAIGKDAGINLTTGGNNIVIGNVGVAGESAIIRIGTSGTHTDIYLAGVIHGDGSGLTNLPTGGSGGSGGTLSGDVTGPQNATVIAATTVTGKVLTGFSSTTGTITAADSLLTAINKLDGNLASKASVVNPTFLGIVTAPTFKGELAGNAQTATTALYFSTPLLGDVTGSQGATAIAAETITGKLLTGFASVAGTVTASDTILTAFAKLDGNVELKAPIESPTFTGTVTAPLVVGDLLGNASTANIAISFSGPLFGDVTGGQNSTVVSMVGGSTASFIASGATLANDATAANTASALVKRDDSGDFAAGMIALTGNVNLPATGSGPVGTISQDGSILLHTFGTGNFFAGASSGNLTMSGTDNTATGENALSSNTTGSRNTGMGVLVLQDNTTGGGNTAVGYQALKSNTGGGSNTAIGQSALHSNTEGDANLAIGAQSLFNNVSGDGNTGVGDAALHDNIAGNGNTAIGASALHENTASFNTAMGFNALFSNIGGGSNTAIGHKALHANSAGTGNTATGDEALTGNVGGSNNTANGFHALFSNLSGSDLTAVGRQALYSNSTADANVALGNYALYNASNGHNNVAIGFDALRSNVSGTHNVGIGNSALRGNTADNNLACGYSALFANTTGARNTGIGYQALNANTTGDNNVAIGAMAANGLTTGSNNIAIGVEAGGSLAAGSNNIAIGAAGAGSDSGVVRIGTPGTHVEAYVAGISGVTASGGVQVFVNSSGRLGTLTSSRRFKDQIHDMGRSSEVLFSLRPVTFRYKSEVDEKRLPQAGLIAEEVQEVAPELVVRDEQGVVQTVRYEQVNAMLLNEFLKEHERVRELCARIAELEAREAEMKVREIERESREKARDEREKARAARLAELERVLSERLGLGTFDSTAQ